MKGRAVISVRYFCAAVAAALLAGLAWAEDDREADPKVDTLALIRAMDADSERCDALWPQVAEGIDNDAVAVIPVSSSLRDRQERMIAITAAVYTPGLTELRQAVMLPTGNGGCDASLIRLFTFGFACEEVLDKIGKTSETDQFGPGVRLLDDGSKKIFFLNADERCMIQSVSLMDTDGQ